MLFGRKTSTGTAAVVMAGAAAAAQYLSAPAVQASTTACGSSCASPSNLSLGTGESLTLSITPNPLAGGITCPAVSASVLENWSAQTFSQECVIKVGVAATSTTNVGQDWVVMLDGGLNTTVNSMIGDGILSQRLSLQYGGAEAVEIEAVPDGVSSDMCLGYNGTSLTLIGCGTVTAATSTGAVTAPTVWILDQNNASNGYEDLVSGAGQTFSDPLVLAVTGSGSTASVAVQPLSEFNGVVASAQMWAFQYGPQSTALLKLEGTKHT
jgi:hypothetical protein